MVPSGSRCRLAGIRYKVIGREHVPATRAVVFCANHQSNIDPPVLFKALHRRLHFLYKAELSKLPILGYTFDVGGFVPIERSNREEAMASIRRGAASIRQGNSFLIFPEGTRSRTDALLPFKKGGIHHGNPGAGADSAGRHQRRPGGHAAGQLDRLACAGHGPDWRTG